MADIVPAGSANTPAVATTAIANPAAVYLAGLAPSGRRSTASVLRTVARSVGVDDWPDMPWCELRYKHVQAIKTRLEAQGLAPATVNRALSAIRGVMTAAWHDGQITAEDLAHIRAVKPVTGSTEAAGRAMKPGELAALVRTCAEARTPAGARDTAIVALGYAAGLRRAELAALEPANLIEDDGQTLTVQLVGKRRKQRTVYVSGGGAQAVRDWLEVRGREPGPLFYAGRSGGHLIPGQGMSPQAVRDIIVRRAQQAGVEHATPHDLRRSFITDLLEAGVDIATTAKMAGHESVQTTQRYDRRGEEAKRKAAGVLHVPYTRQTLDVRA